MGYTGLKPADTQTIAQGPADIRDELAGLATGQVVNAGMLNGISAGNASGKIPVSNGTVNTNLNADKLDGLDASAFASASHTHNIATTSSNGIMSNTDKAKLDGIAAGAQVNQSAFSNVLVGNTTIQADSVTDTLELVAGNNISLTPDATNDRVTIAVTGTVAAATTAAACTGNAATSTKWATARTLKLDGDTTGSVALDGSGNAILTVTVTDDSHNHIIGNVDGLQTTLDAKAPLASPAMSGTPTAPTAAAGSNTTQIATTAFVTNAVSSKANTASPALTGTPLAPTAAAGTNTTQIATTAFVQTALSAVSSGRITSYSLGTSGYIVFDMGLILQWGYSGFANTYGNTEVNFPIPFNTCFHFQGTMTGSSSGNGKSYFGCASLSPTKCTVNRADAGNGFYWCAIGI